MTKLVGRAACLHDISVWMKDRLIVADISRSQTNRHPSGNVQPDLVPLTPTGTATGRRCRSRQRALLLLLLVGLLGFLLLFDAHSFIVYFPVLKFTVLSLKRNKVSVNLTLVYCCMVPWLELNPYQLGTSRV